MEKMLREMANEALLLPSTKQSAPLGAVAFAVALSAAAACASSPDQAVREYPAVG